MMNIIRALYHRRYSTRSVEISTGVVPHRANIRYNSQMAYCVRPTLATPSAFSATGAALRVVQQVHTKIAPTTGSRYRQNCRNMDRMLSQNGLRPNSMKMG